MADLTGKIALVTGASRGIGASVARGLAELGADVVINYRSKGPRAEEVAAFVRALGRRAWLAPADITDEAQVRDMMRVVGEAGRLDVLVLNASGGLEKDKPADYAMQLNLSAQTRLVDLALPLMPRGACIAFVTSHLAHFHGHKAVPALYEPVAASKKAGEDALRASAGIERKRDSFGCRFRRYDRGHDHAQTDGASATRLHRSAAIRGRISAHSRGIRRRHRPRGE